ncbi:Chaperone protein dnaj [Thalictrum thalictroides]|uniref:Chaperone protein dnaj n=1 Tax=Thalictrum thalictroides TaxID=46969 RepID=A0A7J6VKZ5_THATH|nr:Chaperone protein dnaj [Thalictrum thalictroides]
MLFQVFYNAACYYHAYYGHKTDPRAVLVGLLLVLSAFQYLNQWTRYTQAIDMVKKTPAYKNKLRALELERSGGITSKKKGHKQIDKRTEEYFGKELELQIKGAEKPSMWGLVVVQLLVLPYTLSKIVYNYAEMILIFVNPSSYYCGVWRFWRYRVQKASYSWNDACYLTRRSLRVPLEAWRNTDESMKEDLVLRRLWKTSNMENYIAEQRKEMKRRR